MNIKDRISYIIHYNKINKIKMLISDIDGVMTDGGIIVDDNGVESKYFNAQDGLAIVIAINTGIKIAVITGGKSKCVYNRFDMFKKCHFEDLIMGEDYKVPPLLTLLDKYGLKKEEVAYIGDDLIDLAPMIYAGLSFSPNDATDEVIKVADIVLSKNGGHGALRLAIEMILRGRGLYKNVIKEYSHF